MMGMTGSGRRVLSTTESTAAPWTVRTESWTMEFIDPASPTVLGMPHNGTGPGWHKPTGAGYVGLDRTPCQCAVPLMTAFSVAGGTRSCPVRIARWIARCTDAGGEGRNPP